MASDSVASSGAESRSVRMPRASHSLTARLRDFFAFDDDWARPSVPVGRGDVAMAVGLAIFGVVCLELVRSATRIEVNAPLWVQWLAVASGAALLIWRRVYPISVGVGGAVHMFVVGVTMPQVMGQFSLQLVYFATLCSAVAWAKVRRTVLLLAGGIAVFMLAWVAWQFALGSGFDEVNAATARQKPTGAFDPLASAVLVSLLINVVYFVGAIIVGQLMWRSARQRARLVEQAATISAQSESLQRRAVVDERLRIARELHDVVGHHVAVIGIQAGAARRVMSSRPIEAAEALGRVEQSSRDAVSQMRDLLGTLRDIEAQQWGQLGDSGRAGDVGESGESGAASGSEGSRRAEPGLGDLATLVAEREAEGMPTAYTVVESRQGALGEVPAPIGLTLYRVAQEALANVTRHSTAVAADVVVRVVSGDQSSESYAEVEVLDNGRARQGTSGSGLGQLGMRERVGSHRGTVEIGPRSVGGYRVRARIPLSDNVSRDEHGSKHG